ncbi:MAG: EF-hand domain-containing protein, partial [Acinetobacter sp.]
MKILAILCISTLISSYSFACDPTSLDWEKFHQTYDLNKNKTFELKEFLKVKDFDPLPWP